MKDDAFDGAGVPVPRGRLNRLARLGGLATGVAGGMARDGIVALAQGRRPRLEDLLLTPANAARFTAQLAQMRGAAMKVGQLLSMEAGDLLPIELAEILARLRADAEPMPPKQLKAVLVAQWGEGFIRRFARFDVRPIAAASIGQVHRAWTRDGRDLAIKVQYPGVRESIDSDVANVAALIRMSGLLPKTLDIAPLLEEAKRQLHDEADYEREAACLGRFHALLADDPDFRVPAPQPDLTTGSILAMAHIESAPIESAVAAPQAERDRIMERLADLLLREIYDFGWMQTDPNFANYRYAPGPDGGPGRIVLLDFGATRSLPPALVETYRRFLAAVLSDDRAAIHASAIEMGYLEADSPPARAERILDMVRMGAAPLRADAPFDFAASDLIERLRDAGLEFAAARDFGPIPPVDTLFLQRKVAGLFLLGARLKARVSVRAKIEARL